MSQLKQYKIEGGRSDESELGFVCYIQGESPEQALANFTEAVSYNEHKLKIVEGSGATTEVIVYFFPNSLTVEENVEEVTSLT